MKKISYLIFILFCYMFFSSSVNAAASASVKPSLYTVTMGNSVTITTTFSSNKTIFFIEGTLSCSGAGVSKTQSLVFDNNSNNVYSKTFTLKLTPSSNGTISCSTKGLRVIDASQNSWQNISNKFISVSVRAKSTNNNLASLSIDGYTLDKEFNASVYDYAVTVKEGTEKIKVNAKAVDGYAKVSGTGEVSVSEGLNDINVLVTAENGSKKTYNIKVTVLEYEPIKVSVLGREYTVVRKRKSLPKVSEYFTESSATIGDEVVDSYYYEKLDYNIVGLKDSDGKIEYFIYDGVNYTYYNEQSFNGVSLRILDKELPKGYNKKNFTYNDKEIVGYQEVKLDIIKNTYALSDNEIEGNDFYLFYAINMDTLKEELYQYDLVENTVQRYNTLILDMYKNRSDTYYMYLIYSIMALGGSILLFSIILIAKGKKKKRKIKFEEGDLF